MISKLLCPCLVSLVFARISQDFSNFRNMFIRQQCFAIEASAWLMSWVARLSNRPTDYSVKSTTKKREVVPLNLSQLWILTVCWWSWRETLAHNSNWGWIMEMHLNAQPDCVNRITQPALTVWISSYSSPRLPTLSSMINFRIAN